jgi:hypothetical protein
VSRKINVTGWPVMAHCCATCPFGERGDPGVRESVVSRIVHLGASQICHHSALHGKRETHLCRGARDFQLTLMHRMGMIAAPTNAAFSEASRKALA